MISLLFIGLLYAQQALDESAQDNVLPLPPSSAQAADKPQNGKPPAQESVAEQIARIKRMIEADQEAMKENQAAIDDPNGEFKQAETDFNEIDEKTRKAKKELEELSKAGETEKAEKVRKDLESLEKTRLLSKERFDLAIQEQKLLKEKIATIEQKIVQEQMALDQLTGNVPPAPVSQPATASAPTTPSSIPPASGATSAPTTPATGAPTTTPPTAATAPPATTTPAPSAALPGMPAAPTATKTTTAPDGSTTVVVEQKPLSQEMVKAQADAKVKAEVAKKAEDAARSITERMSLLDATIVQERTMLETLRQKADNANKARSDLAEELQKKSVERAPQAELEELVVKGRDAEKRFVEARAEVKKGTDRLNDLQSERAELLAEQNRALGKAQESRKQVAVAESTLKRLQNPFSPHNMLQWLLDHLPRLIAIVLGMFFLQALSGVLTRRIVRFMSRRGMRGTIEERRDRAQTLVGVFHNATTVVTIGGAFLMIVQEVGVPIAPLMGGAAVVGLAVAFGAQNLIRDYFYGFVILLENQFKLNDVVQIGTTSGQVEQITLRMTVLRDLEGKVHFIPNGEISSVTNMTHGWSRAFFDLGVAYKEDIDRVIQVVVELGREMRQDKQFGPLILEDLVMLGVNDFADSAVMLKFYMKTRPLQQWPVRREMLRRIKRRFDEVGIEIPFPHRTVFHRLDGSNSAAAAAATGAAIPAPHENSRKSYAQN